MSPPAKLSPAVSAALRAVLQSGPFSVYVTRGFTGFAQPRTHIYGPAQLSKQVFNRLRSAGLVRQLLEDDMKGMWDISYEGIEALKRVDAEIAALSPEFQQRRLNTPKDVLGFDNLGLARRLNASCGERSGATVHSIRSDPTASAALSAASKAAHARHTVSSATLGARQVSLGLLANECLAVSEAFLQETSGAGRVDITLQLRGNERIEITCNYVPLSFDASVSSDEPTYLKELLRALCQSQTSDLADGEEARILLSVTRRKHDGLVPVARLPNGFSIAEVTNQVRAAIVAVAPQGLIERPLLTIRYGTRRWRGQEASTAVTPLSIGWERLEGGANRRALEGPGSVKANDAVWRAASALNGVTTPPCRSFELKLRLAL